MIVPLYPIGASAAAEAGTKSTAMFPHKTAQAQAAGLPAGLSTPYAATAPQQQLVLVMAAVPPPFAPPPPPAPLYAMEPQHCELVQQPIVTSAGYVGHQQPIFSYAAPQPSYPHDTFSTHQGPTGGTVVWQMHPGGGSVGGIQAFAFPSAASYLDPSSVAACAAEQSPIQRGNVQTMMLTDSTGGGMIPSSSAMPSASTSLQRPLIFASPQVGGGGTPAPSIAGSQRFVAPNAAQGFAAPNNAPRKRSDRVENSYHCGIEASSRSFVPLQESVLRQPQPRVGGTETLKAGHVTNKKTSSSLREGLEGKRPRAESPPPRNNAMDLLANVASVMTQQADAGTKQQDGQAQDGSQQPRRVSLEHSAKAASSAASSPTVAGGDAASQVASPAASAPSSSSSIIAKLITKPTLLDVVKSSNPQADRRYPGNDLFCRTILMNLERYLNATDKYASVLVSGFFSIIFVRSHACSLLRLYPPVTRNGSSFEASWLA
jgi:hypothetical protein